MKREMLFTALLVVLVLVSTVQAIQLADLNNQIEKASITAAVSEGEASAGSSGGSTSLPSSLENLPGMVGGC